MMATLTPWWRSTSKADMEKPSSACLVATYEHCSGLAATAAMEPVLMMAPPCQSKYKIHESQRMPSSAQRLPSLRKDARRAEVPDRIAAVSKQ
jgi:hypothetical protein